MANGVLGSNTLSANTVTTVYSGPASGQTFASVNFTNRSAQTVWVTVGKSTVSNSFTNPSYIAYKQPVEAYGVLLRTGVVVNTGEFVVVETDSGAGNCVVYGVEQA